MIEKSTLPICGECFSELRDGERESKQLSNIYEAMLHGMFYRCPSCDETYSRTKGDNYCSVCNSAQILIKPKWKNGDYTDLERFIEAFNISNLKLCTNELCPSYNLVGQMLFSHDKRVAIVGEYSIELDKDYFSFGFNNDHIRKHLLAVANALRSQCKK